MKLHALVQSKGIKKKKNQVGRGNSSKGNYSGKGLKGQKARSGSSMKPFFEGGQTSIVQRLPKRRGFKRYFKLLQEVTPVNLDRLEKDQRITDGQTITLAYLMELGYIDKGAVAKILAKGSLQKKLQFAEGIIFSQTAKVAIENVGGSVATVA